MFDKSDSLSEHTTVPPTTPPLGELVEEGSPPPCGGVRGGTSSLEALASTFGDAFQSEACKGQVNVEDDASADEACSISTRSSGPM
jgi:hypothetical protein